MTTRTTMRIVREIEVEIEGYWNPAEPDVGIMTDYFDEITAVDAAGCFVELTEDEELTACGLLEYAYLAGEG